jgi:hypothetical protein
MLETGHTFDCRFSLCIKVSYFKPVVLSFAGSAESKTKQPESKLNEPVKSG